MECPYNFQKDLLTFDNKHRKPYWKEGKSMIARERWLRGYISLVEREASRSKKKTTLRCLLQQGGHVSELIVIPAGGSSSWKRAYDRSPLGSLLYKHG